MKEVKKMGRHQKNIDKKLFENLCGIQCNKKELCAVLEVSDKTLDAFARREYGKNFSEVWEEKRGIGKISLRRAQFRLAEKNANMAIWLGKQYLDQKDKQEIDHTVKISRLERLIESIENDTKEP